MCKPHNIKRKFECTFVTFGQSIKINDFKGF